MASVVAERRGLQLPNVDAPSPTRLRRTRTAFLMLCGYLLSQSFMIPLRAVGPSWALWPSLSDVFAGLMVLYYAANYRYFRRISPANSRILQGLMLILAGTFSVLLVTYTASSVTLMSGSTRAGNFGIFELYRLVQFTLIFRVAAGIPFTPKRLRMLSTSVGAALLIAVGALAGTYSSVIRTSMLVAHLPSDFNTAGPWAYLANTQLPDVGTIGYNHGYTAVQIVMLVGLYLSLQVRQDRLVEVIYLLVGLGGVFLTGSRAGLVAIAILTAAYFLRKPSKLIIATALSILLLLGVGGMANRFDVDLNRTYERDTALAQPLDPQHLSGRQDIWHQALAFVQADPTRWMIGAGPGSAAQLDTNAHMMILHVVVETGIVGLTVFGWLAYTVLRLLRKQKSYTRPLLWVSVALLISSLTQETFYPIPAFGHFLGFYLCSLAIALSAGPGVSASQRQQRTLDRRQLDARNHRNAVLQLGADAR